MKKLAAIFGALVTLVIAGALIAPFFIDLNDYKPEIAEQAKAATGRDLAIDGDISLSLLPMPRISVAGVRFGNAPGTTQPDMLTLQSISVKVALMPLLSGDIQVKEVVLRQPNILLEKLPDGTGNWVLAAQVALTEKTESSGGGGLNLAIESAVVEGGTLIYRDPSAGIEQKVENINAKLKLDSLEGPFDADGGLIFMGIPLGFSVRTARIDLARPITLDVALKVSEADADLGFSGVIDAAAAGDPASPFATGKITAKGTSLAKLLGEMPGGSADNLPPLAGGAFSLEGNVKAGRSSATIEDLTANLGDLTAKAGLVANFEPDLAFRAKVAIGRLDLDQLLGPPAPASSPAAAGLPSGFSLPSGIDIAADIAVQQIAYRGQAIDDARLSFHLAEGLLQITEAAGKLPGSSAAELSGTLSAEGGQPNFIGGVKLDSDNLRALIEAFQPGVLASIPADRLRLLAFTSRLAYSPARAELADIAATLDQSQLAGGIVLALPDGVQRTKPGFGIGLSVDKINLDGYLPRTSEPTVQESKSNANPLLALAPLAELEANIELRAGALTLNEQQVNGLHLLAAIGGGAVEIKNLSVKDFLGGKGNIAGTLTELTGDPKYDAKFDVTAKETARVLRMAGLTPPEDGKLGALSLKGSAAGNWTDVNYDVALGMAGIGLQGVAKGRALGLHAGVPRIDTNFDVKAKDISLLAAMAGVPADTARRIGAFAAKGSAASGADDVTYDMALSMAGIGLQGNVKGRAQGLSAEVPRIDATFDLKAKDIAPVASLAGLPIELAKELGAIALAGRAVSGADDLSYDVTLGLGGIEGAGALKGRITGLKGDPVIDTALDLKAEKPAPLLRWAGLAGPKANAVGPLGISGTLKGRMADMTLDLDITALGGVAKIAGNVQAKVDPMGFDLALAADHPEFSTLAKLAELPSSGEAAGPLRLRARASGSSAKVALSGIDATWGESRIEGEGDYDSTGAKPYLRANLSGGTVDLRPFMAPAKKKKAAAKGAPWSVEPLDLSVLDRQDADVDFTAQSLLTADQRFDDLVARVAIRDGRMTMNALQGRIYGGTIDLGGTQINGRGTPEIRAKVALNQIQMSELLGEGIAGNQVRGPLSVNLTANGKGGSEAEIVRSLRGKGDIGGTIMVIGKVEQTIGSTLLNVLGQQVSQVQGITNLVNGVVGSFMGVDNVVSGTFAIKEGELATRDFAFINPNGRGAARGRIDLAAWTMKMLVDLYGANADQAFMSLDLTGPVDGPNVAFVPGGAAGPSGLLGLAPGGQFTPNALLQQIPGLGDLLGGQLAPIFQPVQPAQPGGVLQPGAVLPSITQPNDVQQPGVLQPSIKQPEDVLQQLLGTEPVKKKKKKKKAVEQPPLEPGALPPSP